MSKSLVELMSKTKRIKPRLEAKRRLIEIRKCRYRNLQPIFPLVMMFETTGRCNQKCVMCPRNSISRSLAGNMDFNLFKKVIDETVEYEGYPSQITLHYSGEPLLTPKLWEFVTYAKEKGKIPFVRFNSNGMLLTKRTARKLIHSGLDRLTIALEPNRDIHNKTRVGSDYDVVTKNIVEFMKLKDHLKSDKPELWIQFLFSKNTTEQDIFDGVKAWENIVDYVEVESVSNIAGLVPDMGSIIKRTDCFDAWINASVLWNGDVTTCCADHNGELVMGNVSETSIKELWDGHRWAFLRKRHKQNNMRKFLPELCLNCLTPISRYARFKRKVRRTTWNLLKTN